MEPKLSRIGTQMSNLSGVRAILKDIQETLRLGAGKKFINLSPGNPLIIPAVETLWRDCTKELLSSPEFGEVVGRYGASQGYQPFIDAIVRDFNTRYGLQLTERNILVTPGSQSLYFYATNAFGGVCDDGSMRKVLLPLSPEYTGYGGLTLTPESLVATKPNLDIDRDGHRFKYRPDLESFRVGLDAGCVLFSRPCNPTGNVVTDEEARGIVARAAAHAVPVLIDSAYAPPYPALNYTEMTPIFGGNIIHCISLSKAGLPGERIGVAIGDPELLRPLEAFQSNAAIHSPRFGQAIAARAIASGRLAQIAIERVRPFYQRKFAVVELALDTALPKSIPWYLHRGEGALFAWLWLEGLPITDWELYQKLKNLGVIIVPGSTFFPGLHEQWRHKQECVRISLTASDEEIAQGMQILASAVTQCY